MNASVQTNSPSSSPTDSHRPKGWYKQFWPWFLLGLPLTSVIAGITTVFIAFNNADSLVNDNYYKDGLAINQTLAQDIRATALNLSATIAIDTITGEVMASLTGELAPPEQLQLLLLHPVDERHDTRLILRHTVDGKYRADLENLPKQRYYLRLQPLATATWRLNGELDFASSTSTQLTHNE